MHVNRERFVLLAAALAACHEARERAVVTIAPLPSSPPSAHRPDLCDALRKQNDLVFSTPHQASTNEPPTCPPEYRAPAIHDASKRPAFATYCHPSNGGTWAVELVSVSLDDPGGEAPPCGWAAKYRLIHVRDGHGEDRGVAFERDYLAWSNESDEWAVEALFDYDGDGQDEIVLSRHRWVNGGGENGAPALTILQARGSAIVAYPVAGMTRAMKVVDPDQDGRPDLTDERLHVDCPGGLAGYTLDGPSLLLHSLKDGTFSNSDEVARRWAITQCPTMPQVASSFRAAGCQRLWGRRIDAIQKDLGSTMGDCATEARAAIAEPVPLKTLDIDTPRPFPIAPERE